MNDRLDKVGLGDVVRDTITGFEGVVCAKTEWLNGCVRVQVQPKQLREGKPIEAHTFDIEQLELVKIGGRKSRPTGGDRPSAVQRPNAKR